MNPEAIQTITLPLPLKMGSVNCYLLTTASGFILIDTGGSNARTQLERELASAGCQAGNIQLILITHGDFDHTGNAAYLCDQFRAKIAMHKDDSGMAERGDMFWNRKKPNFLIRVLMPLFSGFPPSARFSPDLLLEDGQSLSTYGLEAQLINLTGHSKGSLALLTARGDLFCGDLFSNTGKPALNSLMDDPAAAGLSLAKLRNLPIATVYPGHGSPFHLGEIS